jgi:16S rRNA (adenine1518-N6/adenine1519-N6)-dimethyltransferase
MYPKPKKRLGQNFLVDQNIQRKIINACAFNPDDTVLEIGPGTGELTGLIAQKAGNVYAVEIDRGLCGILNHKFGDIANLKVVNCDILEFDLKKYFKGLKTGLRVFGNIPYYISSPILEHLFKYRGIIKDVFISTQKEFAARVVASAGCGDFGSLSCFVQYYAKPQPIFNISKNCFYPCPQVDSSFLKLSFREKPLLTKEKEEVFFKIVRASFNKRRKTLRNSLRDVILTEKLNAFFAQYRLNPDIRPQDLTLENFLNLAQV